jgi:lysophospholipase L1-like esterase
LIIFRRLIGIGLLCFAAAFGISVYQLAEAQAAPQPVRVVFIGDSFPHGVAMAVPDTPLGNHGPTYRYYAWNRLVTAGYNVDFVGMSTTMYLTDSVATGSWKDFDDNHQAQAGDRAEQMRAKIPGWFNTLTPDVVVIRAGGNDIAAGQSPENVRDDLIGAIGDLRAFKPNVKIVLESLTPCAAFYCDTAYNNQRRQVGNYAQQIASVSSTVQSPIVFVDQFTDFNAFADTSADMLHANAAGDLKLANKVYAAFTQLYPQSFGNSIDNNNANNSGKPQLAYTGVWTGCTSNCDPNGVGLYQGAYHSSTELNARINVSFDAPQSCWIKVYGVKRNNAGIAAMRLNAGAEEVFDLYTPSNYGQAAVWRKDVPAGMHSIQIRVAGQQNPGSAGTAVNIDRIELCGSAIAVGAPTSTPVPPTATSTVSGPTQTPAPTPSATPATPAPTPSATPGLTPRAYVPFVSR